MVSTGTTLEGLTLGNVHVETPVVLAPMAGITNTAFRRLCREYGGGLYVNEMVTARALVEGDGAAVQAGDTAGELPGAVGGLEHLGVDGPETGEELVGGFLADLGGHRGVHGGGELVHDGAQQVVVRVVGGDVEHGLVGGVEAAGGDQVRREVPGDLQGEGVLAGADALVRLLRAGDGLPVEDVPVREALGDLPAGLEPGAVGGRGTGVLHDQGRIDLVQVSVGIPVGVEVDGAIEQRHHGQRQDGEFRQQAAGHALEFGAGQPQHSHRASSSSRVPDISSVPAAAATSREGAPAAAVPALPIAAAGPVQPSGTRMTAATTASGRPAS